MLESVVVWKTRGKCTEVELAPSKYVTAIVVGVEVHVEGIHIAVSFIVHNDSRGSCSFGLSLSVGFCAFDPCGILRHIIV